jgi:hypothetical protein
MSFASGVWNYSEYFLGVAYITEYGIISGKLIFTSLLCKNTERIRFNKSETTSWCPIFCLVYLSLHAFIVVTVSMKQSATLQTSFYCYYKSYLRHIIPEAYHTWGISYLRHIIPEDLVYWLYHWFCPSKIYTVRILYNIGVYKYV